MAKFEKFQKSNLKALRREMQELLDKYGVDSNLEFEVGNMSFSDSEVNIKVSAKVKGAQTMADVMLITRAQVLGLSLEKNGYGEKLVGYNSRAYKMPFIYETKNGKRFKCDERSAKLRFAQ